MVEVPVLVLPPRTREYPSPVCLPIVLSIVAKRFQPKNIYVWWLLLSHKLRVTASCLFNQLNRPDPPPLALRLTLTPGEFINSIDVCGGWDDAGRVATVGLTFSTQLGTSNMAVGGQGFTTACENGLGTGGSASATVAAVSGHSAGSAWGPLLYLSGSDPDTVLHSLCFQWNVSP